MHIIILSRSHNRSPLVLAQSLKSLLESLGCRVTLLGDADGLLRRIMPLNRKPRRWANRLHYRMRQKLGNFFNDRKTVNLMRTADAVILSECIPNAFWKDYYDMETLRKRLRGVPLGVFEVFFLRGAPVLRSRLEQDGDHLEDRYDFHLGVSAVSYVKNELSDNEFVVGLALNSVTDLKVAPRKEFHVLVDFEYPGNEALRNHQIAVLTALRIPFTAMDGEYSFSEIRALYRKSAVLLIQHPESFGLPIAECLACGCLIMTPDSGWPMAFRLDASPTEYGLGILPEDLFKVFERQEAFAAAIVSTRDTYRLDQTPTEIASRFRHIYPALVSGCQDGLQAFLNFVATPGRSKRHQ